MTERTDVGVSEAAPQATRWSLVARLHDADEHLRRQALETLLRTYLPVLEWYLGRHPGLDSHRREDLVQGFVASKILAQQVLERADPARGRFRTFLLNAFQNYVRDELRKASAARRTPSAGPLLPLDDADGVATAGPDLDRQFHLAWLRHVLTMAVESMEAECAAHDRADVWSVFRSRLLDPLLAGAPPEPYSALVARLGIESPSRAANLLVTAKRMFSRHLHAVVRETVANPAQAEAELRELKQCL